MTPGENSPSTPEDDDPFGYLYADGQARGAQPPSGGYGYPNSVSRVRAVGERTYGGQQAPQYGQQPGVPPQQQQGAYGQPNAHYQAPETLAGGAPTSRQPLQPTPGRRGPNTKGLLIGAIAVVAAVVIGIGVAMLNGGSDDNKSSSQVGTSPTQSQSSKPSPSSSNSAASGDLPKADASALQLAGGATKASDVKGAQAAGGTYVGGLNTVGSSVTWTFDNVPEDGTYTIFARFSNAGEDQSMTLTVNGKPFGGKFNLGNFTHKNDPAEAWTETYAWPTLNKGSNTISLSCQPGDKCDVLLDQLWLKKGQVKRDS
ncbi:carbohydrate-binding protein [Streptomyces diastatochromogenes]|uniref:Carbohydrate-binding protein n=1 Tax=Streptomyces diastatochromogenes TaxID=42236 RepID=A0A233SIN9_STRDA|nr:carbohydrate-binding protein [Streptomyces diastatochromogenes]OXY95512.1 carbohydrate-binding protein [Streptomyces diastatochromogenes]